MRAVIGIDPGTTGSAWLIDESRDYWCRLEFGKQNWRETEYDIRTWFSRYVIVKTYIENVHNLPGDRGDVAWQFAKSVGRVEQILTGYTGIVEKVNPQTWQAALSLSGNSHVKPGMTDAQKQAARKKRHLNRAIIYFTEELNNSDLFIQNLTQVNSDGLLIAAYGWRHTFTPEKINDVKDSTARPGSGVIRTTRKRG